jgi:hypothetical protein
MSKIFQMGVIGLAGLVFLSGATASARDDEWKGKLEDALSRMEEKIEAMKKILGQQDESLDTEDEPTKRKYRYHYVIYHKDKHKGPVSKYTSKRNMVKEMNYYVPPPAEEEQDVYWVMQLHYLIEAYSFRTGSDTAHIHMVRIKKRQSPEAAINQILNRYRRDVAEGGNLREAFVHDVIERSARPGESASLAEFEVRKLAGPFDNPDEACGPVAAFYSRLGFESASEVAWRYQVEDPEQELRVIWDNPKKDDEVYYVFWE